MAVNYYPRCPNPELTFGLPGHTDPNVLTVLLQGHVSGLQVYKNGQWCAVQPIPNAFVVNVGDQLQVYNLILTIARLFPLFWKLKNIRVLQFWIKLYEQGLFY
jgi:hypothetical protein